MSMGLERLKNGAIVRLSLGVGLALAVLTAGGQSRADEPRKVNEPYVLNETEGYSYLRSDEAFYTAIEELVDHTYARYEAAEAYVASQR